MAEPPTSLVLRIGLRAPRPASASATASAARRSRAPGGTTIAGISGGATTSVRGAAASFSAGMSAGLALNPSASLTCQATAPPSPKRTIRTTVIRHHGPRRSSGTRSSSHSGPVLIEDLPCEPLRRDQRVGRADPLLDLAPALPGGPGADGDRHPAVPAKAVPGRLGAVVGRDERLGLLLGQLQAERGGVVGSEHEVLAADPERGFAVPRLDVDAGGLGQPRHDLLQAVHVGQLG